MKKATVKCPKCGEGTEMDIPENMCIPSYKCKSCGVCEFSDDQCPYPNKHKKTAEK
jgi:ribosomal protein S27AE